MIVAGLRPVQSALPQVVQGKRTNEVLRISSSEMGGDASGNESFREKERWISEERRGVIGLSVYEERVACGATRGLLAGEVDGFLTWTTFRLLPLEPSRVETFNGLVNVRYKM